MSIKEIGGDANRLISAVDLGVRIDNVCGGGSAIGGNVNTQGGDFIGRDQYNNQYNIYNQPSQHTNDLSEEEKELLVAANENEGKIVLLYTQQTNDWVRIKKDYLNPDDQMYAALYIEALKNLMERRYVVHKGGQLYVLTGSGFKKARYLEVMKPTDYENMLTDIFQNGPESKYWDRVVPYQWKHDPTSWMNQMYIAGLIYKFRDAEIMRLISERSTELEFVLEETDFQFWLQFFAKRRSLRPAVIPQNVEMADILRHGKDSQYWKSFTETIKSPWSKDVSQNKLFVAGKIYGLSDGDIYGLIEEETLSDRRFPQKGFFAWVDYLEELLDKQAESESSNEEFDVKTIEYRCYRNYALNNKEQVKALFFADGKLDEDWLREIHFNATHSMAGSTVTPKSMYGFIMSTVVNCLRAGRDSVQSANQILQRRFQ